jgi:uncharacterized membrane protein
LAVSSICGLIKLLLTATLQIGIPVGVLFIVYAGFKFVLASGNPGALQDARRNFLVTIIGIAIFLGSWLLTQVIANTVNSLQVGNAGSTIVSCH